MSVSWNLELLLENIENFYSSSGAEGKDAIAWAKAETSRNVSALDRELNALSALISSYGTLAQRLESIQQATNELRSIEEALSNAEKRLAEVTTDSASGSSELLALWKVAHPLLQNHSTAEACPLCESSENAVGLADKVAHKISQLSNLNDALDRKKRAELSLSQSKQKLQAVQETIEKAAQQFGEFCLSKVLPKETLLPKETVPSSAGGLATWLEKNNSLPEQWNKLESQRQDKKQFLATLKKSLKNYEENVQQQQELTGLIPKLERALHISEDERRKFTDELLFKIADEVGRLYEIIHPGEGKNKISLELNPKKRASLNISTAFGEELDVPPQAYFSESHLDTLGLCVFLALAGMEAPEETILVLDDILTSIDEPHVERLINLLYDEAKRFRHCIITTHYRPWKQKFQWGWIEKGQCHFVELSKWTMHKGMTQVEGMADIPRLKDLMLEESPDPHLVCAKAGLVLEAVLDFLTNLYGCSLPRRHDNRYTIGTLLDSINGKLKQSLRVEILADVDDDGNAVYITKPLEPILTEIKRVCPARNEFGAHYNASSFDLPDDDAFIFGRKVLELVEVVVDPDHGWPRSNHSGSYWSTKTETRRLHPLQKPRK